jgi:hypothetical protein
MLIKLNVKNKEGKDLYKNVLTGEVNILALHKFEKSMRKEFRENPVDNDTYSSIIKRILRTEANRKRKAKKLLNKKHQK